MQLHFLSAASFPLRLQLRLQTFLQSAAGLGYLAAGLAVGLGSIGCGIAVANAAPAAIGAVAEEPSSFGKAMIFVALGEGVALYGFLIAFLIIQALA